MKRIFLAAALSLAALMPLTSAAQSGDEQGFDIPDRMQLPQDREELTKARAGWWTEANRSYSDRMSWYNDAKFGCFIHWGVYSVPAGIWEGKKLGGYTEHLMRKGKIPLAKYKTDLVAPFNPVDFNAEEWMQHVEDAGMKYFVITAKHHDGFAMFPSDAYPYDIRQTAYQGGDPMMQLREAARRHGIKFGFYYSHAFDWEHPDAPGNDWDYDNPGGDLMLGGADWWLGEKKSFLPNAEKYVAEKSIPQIKELIRKYDPDIMWFDTPAKLPLYLNIRILEAIRQADPKGKVVVNGRLVRFGSQNLGDYRNTGDRAAHFFPTEGVWESIPTTNESYGYSAVDTVRKSPQHFVRLLASAASKGGNILMNVGPMGNGAWHPADVDVFRAVGRWLTVNGASVYGTERTDLPVQPWGVTTWKGDTLYAHVYHWPKDGKITLGGLRSKIKSARWVSDPTLPVSYKRINSEDYQLTLPATAPDTANSVLALTVDRRIAPNPVRLLDHLGPNTLYTFDATLGGTGLGYGDGKPNRNYVRGWVRNDQDMTWDVRLNRPVTYDVYVDYNTVAATDTGAVLVEIGVQEMKVPYTGFTERQGTNRIKAGTVTLPAGRHTCRLSGIAHDGKQYMCPIAIQLEKRL